MLREKMMDKTQLYSQSSSNSAYLHVFNESGYVLTKQLGLLTTIGRSASQTSCDISISSSIVSRNHAEIALINGTYYYKDLGSTNGTYINGRLYGKNFSESSTRLEDGDIISFEIKMIDSKVPGKVICIFSRNAVQANWQRIYLNDDMAEVLLGRTIDSGLEIDNTFVSQRHASFFKSSNGWAIIDHKSTNGVYLNSKRITYPRYLKEFDVIRISDFFFVYFDSQLWYSAGTFIDNSDPPRLKNQIDSFTPQKQEEPSQKNSDEINGQLCINIVERSVVQRFKKLMLLQDINLSINSGEMVLILGGSGAGKTTFINAVMGYEKASGKITYNDTNIYEEYEQMKYEIGFVPQQDLLRGSDSVYDTLANAAEMKLPKRYGFDKREQRIESVLDEFGLSREKNTLVSKLSGGQRKRLSIAVEFISDPSLFFLDEPDSGLDDVMGRGLMENLRGIADKGKIVLVITHSPERASGLFDKVIVLAKSDRDNSGHLAFYGTVSDAFEFFEVSSFKDIVKKINRKDENGDGLSDFYIEKYCTLTDGR